MLRTQTRQENREAALLVMEEMLGTFVEELLQTPPDRANQKENFFQSVPVLKFKSRYAKGVGSMRAEEIDEYLTFYLNRQEDLVKSSFGLECKMLDLCQSMAEDFGSAAAIQLLSSLNNLDADNDEFLDTLALKEFQFDYRYEILRIRISFELAAIKAKFYNTPALQQTLPYKQLQESLMWLQAQLTLCIACLNNIKHNKVTAVIVNDSVLPNTQTTVQGISKLIEMSIGESLSAVLEEMRDQLVTMRKGNALEVIKQKPFFKSYLAALATGTHAGFDTYLPDALPQERLDLIDEYLLANMALVQSHQYQKEVIRISHMARSEYGGETAIRMLIDIANLNFNVENYIQDKTKPSDQFRLCLNSINQFYQHAATVRFNVFFDESEPRAKYLAESEMWMSFQRMRCIEGLKLMLSGAVYAGERINFNVELPMVEAAVAVSPQNKMPSFAAESVLADAVSIIAELERISLEKKGEKFNNREIPPRLRITKLAQKNCDITPIRFFAAMHVLRYLGGSLDRAPDGVAARINASGNEVVISADYYIDQLIRYRDDALPPICLFPFAQLREKLEKLADICTKGWILMPNDKQCYKPDPNGEARDAMICLRMSSVAIDSSFSMDVMQSTYRDNFQGCRVIVADLQKMLRIMGITVPLQFIKKPDARRLFSEEPRRDLDSKVDLTKMRMRPY